MQFCDLQDKPRVLCFGLIEILRRVDDDHIVVDILLRIIQLLVRSVHIRLESGSVFPGDLFKIKHGVDALLAGELTAETDDLSGLVVTLDMDVKILDVRALRQLDVAVWPVYPICSRTGHKGDDLGDLGFVALIRAVP